IKGMSSVNQTHSTKLHCPPTTGETTHWKPDNYPRFFPIHLLPLTYYVPLLDLNPAYHRFAFRS
ncbi:MAG: hypothetical protein MJK04_16495, partial [Psychrosphaera sp.]|nr:hypothetical protein [Psychrosphaera sp.]